MKTLLTFLAAAIFIGTAVPNAEARESVSIDFFYDHLESYGSWQEVGDYGYCWRPYDIDEDWRPYSDGRWVYTDAGWTWYSEEPYGWAVYHYGRWVNIDDLGWIWVPGTEWGPGWVSWRHSSRYVGWAPLPPEAYFRINIGFSAWVDDYYDIGPRHYCFVENRNFGARRLRSVFIDQRENYTIINQTTNITNITYVNDTPYNGGLRYDQQSRLSSEPIGRYKLDRRQAFEGDTRNLSSEKLRSRMDGDSLSVFAAPFIDKTQATPRKVKEKLDAARVDRGWKGVGSPEQVSELRTKMKSQVKTPEALPPQPKFERNVEKAAEKETQREMERAADQKEKPSRVKRPENDLVIRPGMPPVTSEKKPRSIDSPPSPADDGKTENGKKPAAREDESPGKPDKSDRNMDRGPGIPQVNDLPKPNEERKPKNKDVEPEKRMEPEPRKEPKPVEPKPVEPAPMPKIEPNRPDEMKPVPRPENPPTPQPEKEEKKGKGRSEEKRKMTAPQIARPEAAPREPEKRKEPEPRKKQEPAPIPAPTKQAPIPPQMVRPEAPQREPEKRKEPVPRKKQEPAPAPAPTKQAPIPMKPDVAKPEQPKAPPAEGKSETEKEKEEKKGKGKR